VRVRQVVRRNPRSQNEPLESAAMISCFFCLSEGDNDRGTLDLINIEGG
jgi:hypothetical protein